MRDVSCALWLPRRNCHCQEIKHGQALVSQNGKLILLTEAELGNGKRQTVGSRSFTAAAMTADEGTVQPSPPAIKTVGVVVCPGPGKEAQPGPACYAPPPTVYP